MVDPDASFDLGARIDLGRGREMPEPYYQPRQPLYYRNLAEDPNFQNIKKELSDKIDNWMTKIGVLANNTPLISAI